MLHVVIMAGGSGTRFWPASRADRPKQLLTLTDERSMLQNTVNRFEGLVARERTMVVTNQRLVDAIRQQLPQLPAANVIGEPCRRDTAPCIGLAAAWVLREDPDAVMVVAPSDHVIGTVSQFQEAIQFAADRVAEDAQSLITFGICPSYPAESFGYIERGDELSRLGHSTILAFRVKQFREKPTAEVARSYLETGRFYWNSGIFVWRAATILDQLQRHEPAMHARVVTMAKAMGHADFDTVLSREFAAIEGRSIDFAVMEKAPQVLVIEAPFSWDDLGSWQSLARLRGEDRQGNTVSGRHLGIDTQGCIIRAEGEHLVVTIGLEDCIVVQTPDATLVAAKDREEQVRDVVKQLAERNWNEYL